jgi:hypothetical protein
MLRYVVALAMFAAAVACGPRTAERSARPIPSPVGRASGYAIVAATIDPVTGGSLASSDGLVTLTADPGAVATTTIFTIDEVLTNSAPGAIGKAYRLGPSNAAILAPLTLTFDAAAAGVTPGLLPTVTIAYQDGSGFWMRVSGASRDSVAGTVSWRTTHLSDWSLVGSSGRDLGGGFSIVATGAQPLTFNGQAMLTYAGEDSLEAWYLQGGTISIDPFTLPTNCTALTIPLLTNVAEATKGPPSGSTTGEPAYWFGVSGLWTLSCDAGDGTFTHPTVDLAFDTYGINDPLCARTQVPGGIVLPDHIAGSYVIDCSAIGGGSLTATWNLLPSP